MKKFVSIIAMCLLIIGLVSCGGHERNVPTSGISFVTDEYTNIKGASVLIKNNKVLPHKEAPSQEDIIEWYMDTACSACAYLERDMSKHFEEITKDMTIRFHILAFKNPYFKNEYPNKAATFLLSVAEIKPDSFLKALEKVMIAENIPEKEEVLSETRFKDIFMEVGGSDSEWEKIEEMQDNLSKIVQKETNRASVSAILKEKAGDNDVSVPFIIVGNSPKALDFLSIEEGTLAEDFILRELELYKEARKKK